MDDAAVSAALAARFTGITPPSGDDPLALVTDQLPSQVGPGPVLLVFADDEELEWGPSMLRHGMHNFTIQFLRDQDGDFAARMAAMTAWRPLLRDRIVGQIQLGLSYVDWAELRAIALVAVTYAQVPYDALELTVVVKTREVVTAAA